MSEAPSEIWCDTGLYYDYKTDWSEGSWRNNDNCGGLKYVRADRIEELEERLKAATDDAKEAEAYAVQMEVMLESAEQQGYANAMEAERKRHEARIKELEAKLATAVKALEKIDREYAEHGGWCGSAHATLAELKGEDRG